MKFTESKETEIEDRLFHHARSSIVEACIINGIILPLFNFKQFFVDNIQIGVFKNIFW